MIRVKGAVRGHFAAMGPLVLYRNSNSDRWLAESLKRGMAVTHKQQRASLLYRGRGMVVHGPSSIFIVTPIPRPIGSLRGTAVCVGRQ